MTALTERAFTAALADLAATADAATEAFAALTAPVVDECARCGDRTEVEPDDDGDLVCRDCADDTEPYDHTDEHDYFADDWSQDR